MITFRRNVASNCVRPIRAAHSRRLLMSATEPSPQHASTTTYATSRDKDDSKSLQADAMDPVTQSKNIPLSNISNPTTTSNPPKPAPRILDLSALTATAKPPQAKSGSQTSSTTSYATTGPSKAATLRTSVPPGTAVSIIQKDHQRTGKLTTGAVAQILTNSAMHPRGIKVRLRSGIVGRVQKLG